jgi:Major Facilitator Superfamily
VRVSNKPPRYPWWQLVLLGIAGAAESLVWPLRRMWRSSQPLDRYGLCHFSSVAGDALLAISLADSVFFSLPVGEAKLQVALYLGLTMLPLALAGPLLVPLLDRAGPRRLISFGAAAARAVAAIYAAPRVGTLVVFPAALVLLVLSKIHAITKNGLTMAYAPANEGLMRANARLGRIAVAGAITVAPFGYIFLKIWGATGPIYLAAAAYAVSAALNMRLPHPRMQPSRRREVGPRGRIPELTGPAIGAVGMRAASGFLLFLLAFSLRGENEPIWWFGVLAAAGVLGGFVADMLAPMLPTTTREEAVVVACVSAGAIGAVLAFEVFGLPLLTVYALVAGAAAELSRLAFQSLMQRHAPEGALGRVFVRYEVVFQLAWVGGAFVPALLPIDFRLGILILAALYILTAGAYLWHTRRRKGFGAPPEAGIA